MKTGLKGLLCAVILLTAAVSVTGQAVYAADWVPSLKDETETAVTETYDSGEENAEEEAAVTEEKVPEQTETLSFVNPETNYRAVIEDDAGLMNERELKDLLKKMKEITEFGNAAFLSVAVNSYSTETFAENCYRELFNDDSGLLFMVDMDNRYLYLFSDGKIYRTVTRDYANTITDNVYRYATREDYYSAAWNVYDQAYRVLNGQKISMPMKYICNILLALSLGLLINFFLVKLLTRKHAASLDDVIRAEQHRLNVTDVTSRFDNTKKTYSPSSSSGSSGGSSHHSSGGSHSSGGGGGHSSGGGGGHSF